MSPHRRSVHFFFALPLVIIWQATACAKTITLDDSGTQALEPGVPMRWQSVVPPRGGAADLLVGTTTIRVRINVMPWLKRTVRIYLALPAQLPGPLGASWTTQGQLLPGQLRSGNRVLVYAGPITGGFIEDTLKVQFNVNAALMSRPCPVSFHFEMDE